MFITNPETLPNNVLFKCNKKLANYLVKKHKIPILSCQDNEYYFSKTEQLNNIIDNLPLFVKLFYM